MNVLGMNCPHCDSRATVRNSVPMSPLVRAVYFQCGSIACGHTWKAHIEAVATISPSAIPRPGVNLPISPYAEALRLATRAKSDPRQMELDHE